MRSNSVEWKPYKFVVDGLAATREPVTTRECTAVMVTTNTFKRILMEVKICEVEAKKRKS